MHADEWLIDITGASPKTLVDASRIETLCKAIVSTFTLTPVAAPLTHVFPGEGGITSLWLLSESHLAIHTWPEKQGALLSLGTCRPGIPTGLDWARLVHAHLGPCEVAVRRVERKL